LPASEGNSEGYVFPWAIPHFHEDKLGWVLKDKNPTTYYLRTLVAPNPCGRPITGDKPPRYNNIEIPVHQVYNPLVSMLVQSSPIEPKCFGSGYKPEPA